LALIPMWKLLRTRQIVPAAVYEVQLVPGAPEVPEQTPPPQDEPKPEPPPPPVEEPKPEPKPKRRPEPKPEPPKPVEKPKIEKVKPEEKPKPTPPEKPQEEKKPPDPPKKEPVRLAEKPKTPPAPRTPVSNKPSVAMSQALPIELSTWGGLVQRKVERLWNLPAGVRIDPVQNEAVISFWVARNGRLLGQPEVIKHAADPAVAASAIAAIKAAEPFPVLPDGYREPEVQVVYTFIPAG
jgi:TonB family protein